MKNGKCKFIYTSGARYEGEIQAGRYQGWGRLENTQGDIYDGMFAAGYRDGYGHLKTHDG